MGFHHVAFATRDLVLVEFCVDAKPYTDDDKRHALETLAATEPELESAPSPRFFRAADFQPTPA